MKIKTALSFGAIIILGALYFIMSNSSDSVSSAQEGGVKKGGEVKENVANNVSIENGVQFVSIAVKGGYSPKKSIAQGGIPTKLILKTEGTYDCSASLVIKSLNVRKTLSATGEERIDAGIPKSGDQIQGVCSMGMYSFSVEFN